MYKYLSSYFGYGKARIFKNEIDQSKDPVGKLTEQSYQKVYATFLIILKHEIAKTYKVAAQAFYAFDIQSKSYVTANDIATSNMAFRLPFTIDELRYLLENETVFRRVP